MFSRGFKRPACLAGETPESTGSKLAKMQNVKCNPFEMEFLDYWETDTHRLPRGKSAKASHRLEKALKHRKRLIGVRTLATSHINRMERAEAFYKGSALAARIFLEAAEEQI